MSVTKTLEIWIDWTERELAMDAIDALDSEYCFDQSDDPDLQKFRITVTVERLEPSDG